MAKEIQAWKMLHLTVEGDNVVDVRLDYLIQCPDCGQETSKSLTIDDCNQGQITAIKNIVSAMVQKAEQEES